MSQKTVRCFKFHSCERILFNMKPWALRCSFFRRNSSWAKNVNRPITSLHFQALPRPFALLINALAEDIAIATRILSGPSTFTYISQCATVVHGKNVYPHYFPGISTRISVLISVNSKLVQTVKKSSIYSGHCMRKTIKVGQGLRDGHFQALCENNNKK